MLGHAEASTICHCDSVRQRGAVQADAATSPVDWHVWIAKQITHLEFPTATPSQAACGEGRRLWSLIDGPLIVVDAPSRGLLVEVRVHEGVFEHAG